MKNFFITATLLFYCTTPALADDLSSLGLSQEQESEIRSRYQQFAGDLDDSGKAVAKAKANLRKAREGNASDEEVERLFNEMQTAKQSHARKRFEASRADEKQLNSKQRQQFRKIFRKRMKESMRKQRTAGTE